MSEYKVHRIQFVEFMPKAINSAAVSSDEKSASVALSREDGSIEIRDPTNDWMINQIIPGQEGRTVEHLVWFKNRLFSGGLSGEIIEWDLEKLRPFYTQDSYGGPVWCLKFSYSGKYLAAGCEDGSIRVFEVDGSGISYERSLHKQEHRILSLAWSYDNNFIISGGFDCTIRLYSVKTGAIISRMTTDNLKGGNTMIWSIEVLRDMTVIVGDSLGNTQFWDGNNGTLLQSFRSHQADVLAVVVCNQGKTVYSTGVDSKVVQFNLVHVGEGVKWIQSKSVRATNHDTRTLAVYKNYLFSGGLDPRLIVYPLDNFSSQSFVRYSCLPLTDVVQLARNSNLLLFREQRKLHIWMLKDVDDELSKRKKIFEVQADGINHLICSAISTTGKYVAYSSIEKSKLLELNHDISSSVKKLSHAKIPPSTHMRFTTNEEFLVNVGFEMMIHVINIETGIDTKLPFPEEASPQLPFLHMKVCCNSNYICVVDANSKCFVFSLLDQCFLLELPKMKEKIACFSFNPEGNIFIVTIQKNIYEFDLSEEKFKTWPIDVNKTQIISDMGRMKDKINAVIFNPKSSEEIFFQTKEVFGKIIYGSTFPDVKKHKKENLKKRKKGDRFLKTNGQFSNIMFFDINAAGNIVIVERPMSSILEKLPSSLKLKKFAD